MADYTVRRATLADSDVLIHQRVRMCQDIGTLSTNSDDVEHLSREYRTWLAGMLPAGEYVAWVAETIDDGTLRVVSGGGVTIIPWPPGPRGGITPVAFVYNVYTEPEHRGRGLARRIMEAIHVFCRENQIRSIALNASPFGQPLYEDLGYTVTKSPMMVLSLD
jgi:GNAT superfamily N-acetyltransferase